MWVCPIRTESSEWRKFIYAYLHEYFLKNFRGNKGVQFRECTKLKYYFNRWKRHEHGKKYLCITWFSGIIKNMQMGFFRLNYTQLPKEFLSVEAMFGANIPNFMGGGGGIYAFPGVCFSPNAPNSVSPPTNFFFWNCETDWKNSKAHMEFNLLGFIYHLSEIQTIGGWGTQKYPHFFSNFLTNKLWENCNEKMQNLKRLYKKMASTDMKSNTSKIFFMSNFILGSQLTLRVGGDIPQKTFWKRLLDPQNVGNW